MTIDIDRLEELARAATPLAQDADLNSEGDWVAYCEENAAYLIAANPAAVLELVARLRAAEQVVRLRDAVVERNRALEAIVRDLAAVPGGELIEQGPTGNPACVLCDWGRDGSNEGHEHAESCPWRRAVEDRQALKMMEGT